MKLTRVPWYLQVTSGFGSPLTLQRISAFVLIFGCCGLGASSNVMSSAANITECINLLSNPIFIFIHHTKVKGKGKAEHLYSALRGIQTTLKRSGMDHTV